MEGGGSRASGKRRPSAISINLEKERRESDEDRHCHGGFLWNGREMVFRLADRYGGFQEIWVVGRRKERLDALDGKVPVKLPEVPPDLTKKEDLRFWPQPWLKKSRR